MIGFNLVKNIKFERELRCPETIHRRHVMKNILELLQSAESLLAQADANLRMLDSLEIKPEEKSRLKVLLERNVEANEKLNKKKVALLELLASLSLIISDDKYGTYENRFSIKFERGYSHLLTIETISDRLGCLFHDFTKRPCFFSLCNDVVTRIEGFVRDSGQRQEEQIKQVSALLEKMATLR